MGLLMTAARLAEDVAYARARQALWDRDQLGPFPWMLKTDEEVLRDTARAVLSAAGWSELAIDEVICDHEWDWS